MINLNLRPATINDAPFLAQTIIEAEKSGTDKLSYSTIFGFSEKMTYKYLIDIFEEDIEGCELSVSSFTIAESNGEVAAALSSWVEGAEGIPSAQIKGNLLNYIFPSMCIERAKNVGKIIQDLHVEYLTRTLQIGACYVSSKYRGNGLLALLIKDVIDNFKQHNEEIDSAYTHIFSCNIPSIKSFEKNDFKIVNSIESKREAIVNYLPSNKKYVLKKQL